MPSSGISGDNGTLNVSVGALYSLRKNSHPLGIAVKNKDIIVNAQWASTMITKEVIALIAITIPTKASTKFGFSGDLYLQSNESCIVI
jgi:hypothetical protein